MLVQNPIDEFEALWPLINSWAKRQKSEGFFATTSVLEWNSERLLITYIYFRYLSSSRFYIFEFSCSYCSSTVSSMLHNFTRSKFSDYQNSYIFKLLYPLLALIDWNVSNLPTVKVGTLLHLKMYSIKFAQTTGSYLKSANSINLDFKA